MGRVSARLNEAQHNRRMSEVQSHSQRATINTATRQTSSSVSSTSVMTSPRRRGQQRYPGPQQTVTPNVQHITALPWRTQQGQQILTSTPIRPRPRSEDEMTIKLDCKVCFDQMADIVYMPCAHLVMCRWCSDQHCPPCPHDSSRPLSFTRCPVCRAGVLQKVRITVA